MKSNLRYIAITLAVAAGLAITSLAFANTTTIRAEEKACLDTATSNSSMKQCVWQAFEAADKELNSDYQSYVAKLKASNTSDSKEILKRLLASERAWVAFRNANCDLVGTSMLGGSGESLEIGGCTADATLNRIDELKQLVGNGL